MITRFFRFGRNPNREVVETLYGSIVASARQQRFYEAWEVPDTPLGRFEMLSLHMFLFLFRVRGCEGALADVAQDITDEFFRDVDHSLRELGIGDLSVPKRMKRLARMFYGRMESYSAAIEAGDRVALAAALARNVVPDRADWPQAKDLAAHVFLVAADLGGQPERDLLSGRIEMGGGEA